MMVDNTQNIFNFIADNKILSVELPPIIEKPEVVTYFL